jgi:hypothetical protein
VDIGNIGGKFKTFEFTSGEVLWISRGMTSGYFRVSFLQGPVDDLFVCLFRHHQTTAKIRAAAIVSTSQSTGSLSRLRAGIA